MKNLNLYLLLYLFTCNSFIVKANTLVSDSLTAKQNLSSKSEIITIALGFNNYTSTVNHVESSSFSNFYSIDKTVKILKNSFDILSMVELFQKETFSFTFLLRAGYGYGAQDGALDIPNYRFSETSTSKHAGIGAGLNYNSSLLGFKAQPFILSQVIYAQSEYDTNYGDASDVTTRFIVNYEVQETILQSSAGLRFYSFDSALMSYFSLDYHQSLSQKLKSYGEQNMQRFDINNGKIETEPFGFSIGVGTFF